VVADVAEVDLADYARRVKGTPLRMPLDAMSEWLRGSMAVLNMLEPMTYVQGVGVRLDDRIYYVLGEGDR
jgi:hypothetical protein